MHSVMKAVLTGVSVIRAKDEDCEGSNGDNPSTRIHQFLVFCMVDAERIDEEGFRSVTYEEVCCERGIEPFMFTTVPITGFFFAAAFCFCLVSCELQKRREEEERSAFCVSVQDRKNICSSKATEENEMVLKNSCSSVPTDAAEADSESVESKHTVCTAEAEAAAAEASAARLAAVLAALEETCSDADAVAVHVLRTMPRACVC